jgi:hypothetical protein
MATAPTKPELAPPPTRPSPPPPEQAAWEPGSDGTPADRTVLVFWLIAFAALALITLCDLVMSVFR